MCAAKKNNSTVIEELRNKKRNEDFGGFYKIVSTTTPELREFMSASLGAAENLGMIDRQFYDATGMLDEVYLAVFEIFSDQMTFKDVNRLLFAESVKKIQELIRAEEFTPNDPSTTGILQQEMDALDERFTAEADGDLIFLDELDDISYKQGRNAGTATYLDEALVGPLVNKLGLEGKNLLSAEKKRYLGALYQAIPPHCRTILELFIYGNRSEEEISEIMNVDETRTRRVLQIVTEKFKLL